MKHALLSSIGKVTLSLTFVFLLGTLKAHADTVLNTLDPGALNAALQAGGTVTYSVSGTVVLTNTISLSNTVTLDGTNQSITISGGSAGQIFNIAAGGNFTLRNITLANGSDTNTLRNSLGAPYIGPAEGGAIFTAGSLSLQNCTFTNNTAPGGSYSSGNQFSGEYPGNGGAIYNTGSLNITSNLFIRNLAIGGQSGESFTSSTANGYGGAIYNSGTLSVTNSVFENNSATSPNFIYNTDDYYSAGSGYGGAIYNGGGTIGLVNVTFSSNGAAGGNGLGANFSGSSGNGYGGALYSTGGTIVASNLLAMNNSASGGQGQPANGPRQAPITGGSALGGALYLTGCTATFSSSTFSNNAVYSGAAVGASPGSAYGGCIFNTSSVALPGCTITGNAANGNSGSIGNSYSAAGSALGGAIYNSGTMQINGSSVTNNGAAGGQYDGNLATGAGQAYGGAIYNTGNLEIQGTDLTANGSTGGTFENEDSADYGGDSWGGAIYTTGSLVIIGSTLSANNAAGGASFTDDGGAQGSAGGGAIANAGFVELWSTTLSSNLCTLATCCNPFGSPGVIYGAEIYNTGAIESDTNSVMDAYLTGTPPLTFQWADNGANLSGATNSSYDLGSVLWTSTETYDLIISNSSGLVANYVEIVNTPAPFMSVSSITPNSGPPGGGTSVTITGTNFASGAVVYFGNVAATSVTVVSATNITANTPASSAYGSVNVTVTNGGDFQPSVLANGFTYWGPPQNFTVHTSGAPPTVQPQFQLTGTPNTPYTLYVATNLVPPVTWQPLVTNYSDTNGHWSATDTNIATPARFYRSALQ